MPIFDLSCQVTVSAFTRVKARTLEEAIKIAKSRPVELDGGGVEDTDTWVITDADGEPSEIHQA